MVNKVIDLGYVVVWGALLALDVSVTATTNVGVWGGVGIPIFAALVLRNVWALFAPANAARF